MPFFEDWKEKSKGAEISATLLWEYDLTRFDWQKMCILVMQRVIERGWMKDFYAAIRLYGGVENVKEIIRNIPVLSEKDMSFVCAVFGLKKEELRCYTRKQLREKHLIRHYDFQGDYLEKNTLKGNIRGVKIDCITHNYPYIHTPFVTSSGIRLYSMEDIAAMKLSAIADNGTRLKDFIDIACLSTKLSLETMLDAYQTKYQNSNSIRALKGLSYWEDILFNEPIKMIGGIYKWDMIGKRLCAMMKDKKKIFPDFPLPKEKRKS